MHENPYRSPNAVDETPIVACEFDLAALRSSLRWGVGLLLPLAIINVPLVALYQPLHWRGSFVLGNVAWIVLLAAVLGIYGAELIAWLARRLHSWFGGASSEEAWLAALGDAFAPAPTVAAIGAIVWGVWLWWIFLEGFMPLWAHLLFPAIGNALGAVIWLRLLLSWIALRQTPAAPAAQ